MLPLEGIRVVDTTQVMAGPFASMLLGDMGADVIKVEPPGGDLTRRSMSHRLRGEESAGFLALNRNKRSIVLDLRDPADREIFDALIATADVFIENSRPGVAERLGIGYDRLIALNPRLVYASISGFGETGPWSQRPGLDLIAQAMSGLMSATGIEGAEPVKNGIPVSDLGAALFAVYGILGALIAREKTGEGQRVATSLFEAALGLSIWEATELWASGRNPRPLGSAHRMLAPYQALAAADGHLVVGAANDRQWRALLDVLDRPDLADDPRFATNDARLRNRRALTDALEAALSHRTVAEWVDALLAAGIPAGPIQDYETALASEHTAAREMVVEIDHPVEGRFRALGFPVKLSGSPLQVRRPPPLLDEHGAEIREEITKRGLRTDGSA